MIDNTEQNPSFTKQNAEKPEQLNKSEGVEKSNRTSSAEEFIKKFVGEDTVRNINEFVQGLGAANVYIDARSGGAYFTDQVDITGDVIGGNQTKSTKRSSVKEVAGQILSANIEKVRSVYVETSSYKQAKSVLDEKHVLILQGDPHLGKQTTAIHLLSLLEVEEIFEIDPAVPDLSSFQGEAKQLYVIDTLAADSAGKLSSYLLNGLSRKLREQHSYLVITIDSRVQISQEILGEYILNWNVLPTPEQLLEKHLRWYLKDQGMLDSSYALVQSDSVRELLNNKLLPGDIDRLAILLSKVVSQDLTLDEALARFSVRAYQQVKSWFSQERNLSQRVFMISLAVLSGSSYQAVVDASQSLQSLIKSPLENEQPTDSEPVFDTIRSQRLKEVFAHLVQGYENTDFGRSPVELIEFDNPAFQPAVLSYVWHEYERLRQPLLVWLHELGSHRDFEVRIRAAAAVGELSKYAFRDVLDQVLRPWANCQDRRLQRLAALALSIPVFESDLAPQVLGLLHSWSTLKNNSRLALTATTAYGGYVGLRFPDVALRDLFAIAQSQDAFLFSAVVESVVSLFEAGRLVPSQYLTVLNALGEWTGQTKITTANQLGLLIFWELMHEAKVPAGSNNNNVPTLLWLAMESQVYEDAIACLLRRALNMKPTRISVLNKIYDWLKLADYDHRLYRVLGRIIYTLVAQGTERERERILYKLTQWASIEQPNAASKILSVIKNHLDIY